VQAWEEDAASVYKGLSMSKQSGDAVQAWEEDAASVYKGLPMSKQSGDAVQAWEEDAASVYEGLSMRCKALGEGAVRGGGRERGSDIRVHYALGGERLQGSTLPGRRRGLPTALS